MLGKYLRFPFSLSSIKTYTLTMDARSRRKGSRAYGRPDDLKREYPTEKQVQEFSKREIPKGHRQFLDEVIHLANPQVKAAYCVENGTPREIRLARKQELAKRFGKNEKDFGHPAVQVGAMTEDIMFLSTHVKNNNHDVLAFLNLKQRLDQRRKMLQYLARYDYYAYEEVCDYLGINKLKYGNHKEVKNLIIKRS